jgi:two-component system, cell cycle sensor histidine kinase and response regulator CckA
MSSRPHGMLQVLLDTTPDIIVFKDRNLVLLACSESLGRLMGKPTSELIGKTDSDLFSPEQAMAFRAEDLKAMDRGIPVTAEHRFITPEGTRWFESIKTPWRNTAGATIGIVCVERDITDRKQFEELLWQTKLVVEHSPVVLFRWAPDSEAAVEYVSENVQQFGYTPEELMSGAITFHAIMHPDDVARVGSEAKMCSQRGIDSFRQEYRILAKDGAYRWVEDRTAIIRDGDGQTLYHQGAVMDITEHKALEAQLLQSQKMETVGRLAGGVAHDFNNILTAIKGYASLARKGLSGNDQARDDLDQVLRATERASALTHRLLAFSRRQIIALRLINLNDLILDMDKMLRRLIGEDIELVTIPAQDLGSVQADPGQIEQALVNLVVNARDAMPHGGKLTIETCNVRMDEKAAGELLGAEAGDFVLLTIQDTGTGMTHEAKVHLFEPFFTTKEKGKGTGLGLPTVYGIVKQHQGEITVTSEPGRGTAVRIYLPRAVGEAECLGHDESIPLAQGTETILLVEDEPLVRGLALRVLAERGYKVLEAANGDEALRVAREYPETIHLLLTDVVMPQMNGKVLADRLAPIRPAMKVIFMSGYTDDAIVRHGVLEEDVTFLQKPFTELALSRLIRETLDRPDKARRRPKP